MKIKSKLKILIISLVTIITTTFCEKEKVEKPVINEFEITNSSIVAGVPVKFKVYCDADKASFWSGAEGEDYDHYMELINNPSSDEENKIRDYDEGQDLDPIKDTIAFGKYNEPGTYTATFIAINIGNYGEDIKTAIQKLEVIVEASE